MERTGAGEEEKDNNNRRGQEEEERAVGGLVRALANRVPGDRGRGWGGRFLGLESRPRIGSPLATSRPRDGLSLFGLRRGQDQAPPEIARLHCPGRQFHVVYIHSSTRWHASSTEATAQPSTAQQSSAASWSSRHHGAGINASSSCCFDFPCSPSHAPPGRKAHRPVLPSQYRPHSEWQSFVQHSCYLPLRPAFQGLTGTVHARSVYTHVLYIHSQTSLSHPACRLLNRCCGGGLQPSTHLTSCSSQDTHPRPRIVHDSDRDSNSDSDRDREHLAHRKQLQIVKAPPTVCADLGPTSRGNPDEHSALRPVNPISTNSLNFFFSPISQATYWYTSCMHPQSWASNHRRLGTSPRRVDFHSTSAVPSLE